MWPQTRHYPSLWPRTPTIMRPVLKPSEKGRNQRHGCRQTRSQPGCLNYTNTNHTLNNNNHYNRVGNVQQQQPNCDCRKCIFVLHETN